MDTVRLIRRNAANGDLEYWSHNNGWITDPKQATLLPDVRYPNMQDGNSQTVEIISILKPIDTSADAWRDAVANGTTREGYVQWRASQRERMVPHLLVGKGSIEVYVYVDPATGTVSRVVASDESLQDIDELEVFAANEHQTPLETSIVSVTEEGRRYFRQIASSNAWPAWDFSW